MTTYTRNQISNYRQIVSTVTEHATNVKTLDEALDASLEFDSRKSDYKSRSREFSFNEQAQIVLPALKGSNMSEAPKTLTEKAIKDLCAKLAPSVFGKGSAKVLPSDYIGAIDPALRAALFNNHNEKSENKTWLVRCFDDSARAVLSDGYAGGRADNGDFENSQYLRALRDMIASDAGLATPTLVRPYVSPDSVIMKIVIRDVDNRSGNYGLGFALENDEIGRRKLRAMGLVQRHSCTNSIVGVQDGAIVLAHRGSLAAIRVQLKAAMGQALGVAVRLLDKFIEAEDRHVEDLSDVINGLALSHGWSNEIKSQVTLGTEGKETVAAVVNGVTFAAHATKGLKDEDRLDLEVLGGSLLYSADNLFVRAANEAKRERAGLR